MRFIIDAKVKTEPRSYKVSKVNRLSPNGLVRITLAQDLFDPHTDYIELDNDGNVVGFWADYYKNAVLPSSSTLPQASTRAEITYSGTKPEVKIGGSYKTFTVKFYDHNDGELPHAHGYWKYTIDGEDAAHLLSVKEPFENQVKIKFTGDDSYIGKVLVIEYEAVNGIKTGVKMNLIGM